MWKKTKRKLADLIRSASFTEVGVALDYSVNWQTRDIAENGKGIVVVFNGQMDADITAYLPISSFPGGTDINSLISRTDRFVIIGRKDPDKILLNLAPKSDFPPMKMGSPL